MCINNSCKSIFTPKLYIMSIIILFGRKEAGAKMFRSTLHQKLVALAVIENFPLNKTTISVLCGKKIKS